MDDQSADVFDPDAELLELLALALDGEDEVKIAMLVGLTMLSRCAESRQKQHTHLPIVLDIIGLESHKLTDLQS